MYIWRFTNDPHYPIILLDPTISSSGLRDDTSTPSEAACSKLASGSILQFVSAMFMSPLLDRTDAQSIRVFLRKFDSLREISARNGPILETWITTKAFRPIVLHYFEDTEYLKSLTALCSIDTSSSYEELTGTYHYSFLEKESPVSKTALCQDVHAYRAMFMDAATDTITFQVSLKDCNHPRAFKFSRT